MWYLNLPHNSVLGSSETPQAFTVAPANSGHLPKSPFMGLTILLFNLILDFFFAQSDRGEKKARREKREDGLITT